MAHELEPEREFELLVEGRLNQEAHYKRATKEHSLFRGRAWIRCGVRTNV